MYRVARAHRVRLIGLFAAVVATATCAMAPQPPTAKPTVAVAARGTDADSPGAAASSEATPSVVGSEAPVVGQAASSQPGPTSSPPGKVDSSVDMASRKPPFSPKSTPGKIWCEGEYCDLATESCCIDGSKANESVTRCVPKGTGTASEACCGGQSFCSWFLSRSCDEASDCGSGVCCAIGMGEYWTAHECRPTAVGCPRTVCLPGSTCRTGGACIAPDPAEVFDLASYHAACSDQVLPPTCGARRCGEGQVCCWSASTKTGVCAESCDDQAHVDTIYACSAPNQCASRMCTTILGVPRHFLCGHSGWVGSQICSRASECPAEDITAGPGATKLLGCLHDPSRPPGVKICEYAEK